MNTPPLSQQSETTSAPLPRKILITDCEDAQGLIANITGVCFAHQLNIIKNTEFVDHQQGRFFHAHRVRRQD